MSGVFVDFYNRNLAQVGVDQVRQPFTFDIQSEPEPGGSKELRSIKSCRLRRRIEPLKHLVGE